MEQLPKIARERLAQQHADSIILKSGVHLAMKIEARRIRNRLGLEVAILLVRVIHPLKIMRDPSDVVLGGDQLEVRKALEHA